MARLFINYQFSAEKNRQLIQERNISFEEIIMAINYGKLIDIIQHPNSQQYAHQHIYVVQVKEYIYAVPFVKQDEQTIFLKTIFPSRKLTKKYLEVR